MQQLDARIAAEKGRPAGARPEVLDALTAEKDRARWSIVAKPTAADVERVIDGAVRAAHEKTARAEELRAAGAIPPARRPRSSREDPAAFCSRLGAAIPPDRDAQLTLFEEQSEAARAASAAEVLAMASGVDRARQGVTLESIIDAPPPWMPRAAVTMAERLLALLATPQLVGLYGLHGRGKTTLAQAAVMTVCRRGRHGLYRSTLDYVHDLAARPWAGKNDQRALFRRRAVLVVLDSVEHSGRLAWAEDELDDLLQGRQRAGFATILVCDRDSLEEVQASIPKSIRDRLSAESGGTVIRASWPAVLLEKAAWERREQQEAGRAAS